MTTTAAALTVRVTVTDAWDTVAIPAAPSTTVADLKRQALARTLGTAATADEYIVKFRGGSVMDESRSLADLGVPDAAALIVLPGRRRPVR
jgi:hypothetical protein